jgi:hypothetical protein
MANNFPQQPQGLAPRAPDKLLVYEIDETKLVSVAAIAAYLGAVGLQVKCFDERAVNPALLPFLKLREVVSLDDNGQPAQPANPGAPS